MGLIILEILLMSVLLYRQKRIHINLLIFLSFVFQVIILVSYRLELTLLWRREVYWSDAEYYWHSTLEMIRNRFGYAHNVTYVYYSWFIQITSPFISVVWNNISNLMLVNLSFLIAIESFSNPKDSFVSSDEHFKSNSIPIVSYFLGIGNPLVIYSLMRNLKDSLFLFLVVLSIHFIGYVKKCKSTFWFILWLLIYNVSLTPILLNIRPWAFAIPILNTLSLFFDKKDVTKRKKMVLAGVFIIQALVIYYLFSNHILAWISRRDLLLELGTGSESGGFSSLIFGIFRLLLGPGPIRSLFGSEYFQFYTYVGNVCSLVGSTIFWFVLPWVLLKIFFAPKRVFENFLIYFLNLLSIIFIYSYFYGGSAELRFRGVIYTLVAILFASIQLNFSKRKEDKLIEFLNENEYKLKLEAYSLILLILALGGLFFSA